MNAVSLEVGWYRVLWAVQPARGTSILFGEVALGTSVHEAAAQAAREARLALAAEDLAAGLEVVIAFDGSLLWPALHESARTVLLAASPAGEAADAYEVEAGGRLVASLLAPGAVVRVGAAGPWSARIGPIAEAALKAKPRTIGVAFRAPRLHASDERAAERAIRDALPNTPVLLSSDIAPLWGWSDRPLEKTAVSAALHSIVADAAGGARAGLGDAELHVWFASLDGTLIPLPLAERHPYAVLRGLPILSLTAALLYARETPETGTVAAASLHETSSAVARVGGRPAGQSFESALLGARIESIGIGAESRLFLEAGRITLADERAPAGAVPVREVLQAAGLTGGAGGGRSAEALARWLAVSEEEALGAALAEVAERLGTRLRAAFQGAQSAVFTGPLAGALAGAVWTRAGASEVFLPPAFAACGAVAARRAPRASRSAETVQPAPGGLGIEQAARALEELIAISVADLEDAGLRRDALAAVAWVSGAKDAHGVFPALDRAAIAKAASAVVRDAAKDGPVVLEVEVYPATAERGARFPELSAPIAAPGKRLVVAPGGAHALELRIVPSGALSAQAPTRGPAMLADPTGLIFVPEGLEATPAPLGGTRLSKPKGN